MAVIKQLIESFDTAPYQWKFEKKFGESDHIYIFDDNDDHSYKVHFEKQLGFGKKVFRVMLSQKMPSLRMYKRIIGVFKDPMKVIATVLAIVEDFMVNNKGKVNGLAMGVPAKSFGAYMRLVDRIVKRKFMAKINIVDSDFQAPEVEDDGLFYRYLLVAPHRKEDTFDGKWVAGKIDGAAVIDTAAQAQTQVAAVVANVVNNTSAKDTAAVQTQAVKATPAPRDPDLEEIERLWTKNNFQRGDFRVNVVMGGKGKVSALLGKVDEKQIVDAFSWCSNAIEACRLFVAFESSGKVNMSSKVLDSFEKAFNVSKLNPHLIEFLYSFNDDSSDATLMKLVSAVKDKTAFAAAWFNHMMTNLSKPEDAICGFNEAVYRAEYGKINAPFASLAVRTRFANIMTSAGVLTRENYNKAFSKLTSTKYTTLMYPWLFPMFLALPHDKVDKARVRRDVLLSYERAFGKALKVDGVKIQADELFAAMEAYFGSDGKRIAQELLKYDVLKWIGFELVGAGDASKSLTELVKRMDGMADLSDQVAALKEFADNYKAGDGIKDFPRWSQDDARNNIYSLLRLGGSYYWGAEALAFKLIRGYTADLTAQIKAKGFADPAITEIAYVWFDNGSRFSNNGSDFMVELYDSWVDYCAGMIEGSAPHNRWMTSGTSAYFEPMNRYLAENRGFVGLVEAVLDKCSQADVEKALLLSGDHFIFYLCGSLDARTNTQNVIGRLPKKYVEEFIRVNWEEAQALGKSAGDFAHGLADALLEGRAVLADRSGAWNEWVNKHLLSSLDGMLDNAPTYVASLDVYADLTKRHNGPGVVSKGTIDAVVRLLDHAATDKGDAMMTIIMTNSLEPSLRKVLLQGDAELTRAVSEAGDVIDRSMREWMDRGNRSGVVTEYISTFALASKNTSLLRAMARVFTPEELMEGVKQTAIQDTGTMDELMLAVNGDGKDVESVKKFITAGVRCEYTNLGLDDGQKNDIKNAFVGSLLSLYEKSPDAAEEVYRGLHASYKKRLAANMTTMLDMSKIATDEDPIRMMRAVDAVGFSKMLAFNGIDVDVSQFDVPAKFDTMAAAKATASDIVEGIRKAVPKQQVTKVDLDQKELDKLTVAFDFYNKYKHGRLAVEFLEVYDCHLPSNIDTFMSNVKGDVIEPAFHGTGSIAASMIMRTGFRIVTRGDGVIQTTGKMLGDGIYFSNVLDKVAQYVSDNGYQRGKDQEGYIFEMKAAIGQPYTHHRSAGAPNATDGHSVISPEWVVFQPKDQLKIKRVFKVRLIDPAALVVIKDRVSATSVVTENMLYLRGFKYFLKENSMIDKGVTTYVFMDGNIPVAPGKWVPAEQFNAKQFGRHVRVEPSAIGWMVVIDTKETETVSVRYTPQFAHDKVQLGLFLKRLAGK